MTASYLPGPWWAVVGRGAVVVVEPAAPVALVQRLWAAVEHRGPVGVEAGDEPTGDVPAGAQGLLRVLEVLARDGLGAVPAFAAVELRDGMAHVAARGVLVHVAGDRTTGDVDPDDRRAAHAHDAGLPVVVVDGRGALTWSERSVPGAGSVELRPDGVATGTDHAAGDGAAVLWPVHAGVVRAATLRLGPVAAVVVEPPFAAVAADPEDATAGTADPELTVAAVPEPVVAQPVVLEPVVQETVVREPVVREPVVPEPVVPEPVVVPDVVVPESVVLPDVAVAEVPAVPAGAAPERAVTGAAALVLDDHDGMTILTEELDEIRRLLPGWAADHAAQTTADLDALLAPAPAPDLPPAGAVEPGPVPPRRPVLELSTGALVPLDRPVLVGRAPQVTQATRSGLPRLVAVPSPTHDVSRTHAQVHAEGPLVLVTDLHSTNGVVVRAHGEEVVLEPGRPTPVTETDLVDLGDGATLRVRWED
ncbi:hypothetical protein Cma02nite_01310 [Cellulomonas marina]|uniref:FHA domain-containing protein n=1 Tax=Cellulomonas marina TaxID=988821 RepID=UPI0019421234|nr:FHA domain-containing protein [Cellulomonas marina]GIG27531.1 hypothetical protein Cma02nite_01310 [Cellulomonas marina]